MPRPTDVRVCLLDAAPRHLREHGLGFAICQNIPRRVRLSIGIGGLTPSTCLWCVAMLVRSP
jgi:hypothetical protein